MQLQLSLLGLVLEDPPDAAFDLGVDGIGLRGGRFGSGGFGGGSEGFRHGLGEAFRRGGLSLPGGPGFRGLPQGRPGGALPRVPGRRLRILPAREFRVLRRDGVGRHAPGGGRDGCVRPGPVGLNRGGLQLRGRRRRGGRSGASRGRGVRGLRRRGGLGSICRPEQGRGIAGQDFGRLRVRGSGCRLVPGGVGDGRGLRPPGSPGGGRRCVRGRRSVGIQDEGLAEFPREDLGGGGGGGKRGRLGGDLRGWGAGVLGGRCRVPVHGGRRIGTGRRGVGAHGVHVGIEAGRVEGDGLLVEVGQGRLGGSGLRAGVRLGHGGKDGVGLLGEPGLPRGRRHDGRLGRARGGGHLAVHSGLRGAFRRNRPLDRGREGGRLEPGGLGFHGDGGGGFAVRVRLGFPAALGSGVRRDLRHLHAPFGPRLGGNHVRQREVDLGNICLFSRLRRLSGGGPAGGRGGRIRRGAGSSRLVLDGLPAPVGDAGGGERGRLRRRGERSLGHDLREGGGRGFGGVAASRLGLQGRRSDLQCHGLQHADLPVRSFPQASCRERQAKMT